LRSKLNFQKLKVVQLLMVQTSDNFSKKLQLGFFNLEILIGNLTNFVSFFACTYGNTYV